MSASTTMTLEQRVQSLLEQGDQEAFRALLQIMLEEPHNAIRLRISHALQDHPSADFVSLLIEAAQGSAGASATAAVEALGELGDPRAVDALVNILRVGDATIARLKAAEALGKIGDPRATDVLLGGLNDRSASVRIISAEALGRIGDPRAVAPLVAAMLEGNTLVRRPSVDALGNIGDERALEPLMERLGDSVWDIQWSAAEALGKIGGQKAVGALVNWSHRVFASEENPLSLEEKIHLVREIMGEFFRKLTMEDLTMILPKLPSPIRVRCWEIINPETEEGGWVTEDSDNPVKEALLVELDRKRAASTIVVPSEAAPAPSGEGKEDSAVRPKPDGAVAAFLDFLRSHKLDFAVLIGGAVRSTALGTEPQDLDVAFLGRLPADLRGKEADPIGWNVSLSAQTHEPLKFLAQALGASVSDLIEGKAVFNHEGRAIPVHYVGPYQIEDQETTIGDMQIEQRVRRTVSRYGFLADFASIQLLGLAPTTTLDQMWLDTAKRWGGRHPIGLRHLAAREIHPASAGPLGLNDILRYLYLKHSIQGALGEEAAALLETSAAKIKEDPEHAKRAFSRAAFDRLLAVAPIEAIVEELELLELTPILMDTLDAAKLMKINDLLQRRESERSKSLQAARREADAKRQEMERKKETFDAKRLQFSKHADSLDVSKSTKNDLDERLRTQISHLAAADKAAQEAADRLDDATRKFRRFTGDEDVSSSVLHEHREALAAKREKDAEVSNYRQEVEALRMAVAKRQESTLELQERLERLGGELETAMSEYQEAQAASQAAHRALEAQEAEFTPTPEGRRERLRRKAGA